ncbi:hypothetical protein HDR58_05855 [bacterium]|nr:hypothetical protein [bacterium]
MLKIGSKIQTTLNNGLQISKDKANQQITKIKLSGLRYLNKNTVRAKYNRNMDAALFSGLATIGEILRFPTWHPIEAGITGVLGSIYVRSAGLALKQLIELQPIRARAIKIKKAAKKLKKQEN